MLIDPSRIVDHLTDTIGAKLQTNPRLDEEDVEFAKNIVQCFRQIWEWKKTYPEFHTNLKDEIFRSIFNDMSSYFFASTDDCTDLSMVCATCDLEFPVLNRDLTFSYYMHKQDPEHVETVNAFKEFHSESVNLNEQKPNVSDEGGDANHPPTPAASRDDVRDNTPGIIQCTKKLMGKKSKQKKASSRSLMVANLEKQSLKILSSVTDIYTSDDRSRLAYFLNKICVLIHGYTGYRCGFCNFVAKDENCMKAHLADPSHEAALTQEIKNIDPKCAYIEPGIFITAGDIELRCHLCKALLPRNNSDVYFAHVKSRRHLTMMKTHFKMAIFEDWERGIILRDGSPYCVVCESVLPTEATMREHLCTLEHELNLKFK